MSYIISCRLQHGNITEGQTGRDEHRQTDGRMALTNTFLHRWQRLRIILPNFPFSWQGSWTTNLKWYWYWTDTAKRKTTGMHLKTEFSLVQAMNVLLLVPIQHLWAKAFQQNLRGSKSVQRLWSYSICKNLGARQEFPDWPNRPTTTLLHIYGPRWLKQIQMDWIHAASCRVTCSVSNMDGYLQWNWLRWTTDRDYFTVPFPFFWKGRTKMLLKWCLLKMSDIVF